MYNMSYGGGFRGFGVLATGAKKNSANTKILQTALNDAGYKAGTVDGSFGTNTRAAMQALQASKGLIPTDWPDNYVLAGLDIPYDRWVGIVQDSGAPADVVNAIAQRVAGHGGLPSSDSTAPKAVTLPSGEQIIVEGTTPVPGTTQEIATLPSGEQIIVEQTEVQPAAAAVGITAKAWFQKNWPYLAAGGGMGLLAIIGAVLWTRKRDEEEAPAMPTPEDVEHMAGYRGFGRRMTKAEAVQEFKEEVLPYVVAQYGKDDRPAIREAWNDWTDMLQKDGRISMKQYETWVGPFRGLGDWEHPWSYHKQQVFKHKNWMREHEAGMYGGKMGRAEPGASAIRGERS
jgi:peptidoglycan hydrolase-like protein with peptidoglycan-binding domain